MSSAYTPDRESAATTKRSSSAPLQPARFLGRQPILHSDGRLFGYELFFRDGDTNAFSGDPELATREVIHHWLMLVPETTPCLAFVNCTRKSLIDGYLTLLPAESTVFELPRDLEVDDLVLERCSLLRQRGYRFALDNFLPRPAQAPLLDCAAFVKIDFVTSDFHARREIYAALSRSSAQRIAVRIETECQMRIALSEGCSLFQGYFFSHPVLLASPAVPQNYVACLRLLAALNESPCDLRKVESLALREPSLCYRFLRLANSALQGHPGTLTSLREALLMVGDDAVRKMVTVAMLGMLGGHRSDALVSMALTRARFCELLAPHIGEDPAQLYLVGILSMLDVLLETPLSRILQTLPVSPAMKDALSGEDNSAADALNLVRALELCDWNRCGAIQNSLRLAEGAVAEMYVRSLQWAAAMMHQESMQPEA